MSGCIGGGFGASSGINPVNGLGDIPTSQVDVYDGATLGCPMPPSPSLNDILEGLDACISDKNGTFTPSNTGLSVAAEFIVNLDGNMTWNIPMGSSFILDGKLDVPFIDPDGIQFTPIAANPASTWGVADAETLWINSANGHLYRDNIDLEAGGTSSTVVYDGAATLSTCGFAVSGSVNDVLSTLADEICVNTTALAASTPLVGTARHSMFRVDTDDETILENDFITNTGSSIGIGIGSAGSHFESLSFGSTLLARYSADRDIDSADANTLVDKRWVADFFNIAISLFPTSLWEEGIGNPATSFLTNTFQDVVIGGGDISSTGSRLFVVDDGNSLGSIKIQNTSDSSDGAAALIASGGADETASLGYYSSSHDTTTWRNKAVLSSGSVTDGLLLNSFSDITLQVGGTSTTDSIVNITSDGVAIGTEGVAVAAGETLLVDGKIRLENLDLAATTPVTGDILTLQADGTINYEASKGGAGVHREEIDNIDIVASLGGNFLVEHNLGSTNIIYEVWDLDTNERIFVLADNRLDDSFELKFTVAPTANVEVIVIGGQVSNGGAAVGDNLYTKNGILLDNRIVDGNNKGLSLQNISELTYIGDSASSSFFELSNWSEIFATTQIGLDFRVSPLTGADTSLVLQDGEITLDWGLDTSDKLTLNGYLSTEELTSVLGRDMNNRLVEVDISDFGGDGLGAANQLIGENVEREVKGTLSGNGSSIVFTELFDIFFYAGNSIEFAIGNSTFSGDVNSLDFAGNDVLFDAANDLTITTQAGGLKIIETGVFDNAGKFAKIIDGAGTVDWVEIATGAYESTSLRRILPVDNNSNTNSSDNASLLGGFTNVISGSSEFSSIVSGRNNSLTDCTSSSILSGRLNIIQTSCENSSISSGQSNRITSASNSSINGGFGNIISSSRSFIGAGFNNEIEATATESVICGGSLNTISTFNGFIGGGINNSINISASGGRNTILGGDGNNCNHPDSHIIGSVITTVANLTTHVNRLNIQDIQEAPDDATAFSLSIPTGQVYKTATGELRIKL